jgi:hypothetical protein
MRARRTDEERRQLEQRIEQGFRRMKVLGAVLVLAIVIGTVVLLFLTRLAFGTGR